MAKRKLTKEERRDRRWAEARKVIRSSGMKVENPFDFPGYVYIEPPDAFDAVWKRGGPWFDMLADFGYNVGRYAEGIGMAVQMYRPWTIFYQNVPHLDSREQTARLKKGACVIMDCHFPVMRLDRTIFEGDETEQYMNLVEARSIMLANLRTACAVTVPNEDWAADLAEEVPNVYYLPDINEPGDVSIFGTKFMGMCASLTNGRVGHHG